MHADEQGTTRRLARLKQQCQHARGVEVADARAGWNTKMRVSFTTPTCYEDNWSVHADMPAALA